jgi:hypothetical protein
MQLEGLGQLKKSTPSVLDPATFRLVAWYLNQLRYRAPSFPKKQYWKKKLALYSASTVLLSVSFTLLSRQQIDIMPEGSTT